MGKDGAGGSGGVWEGSEGDMHDAVYRNGKMNPDKKNVYTGSGGTGGSGYPDLTLMSDDNRKVGKSPLLERKYGDIEGRVLSSPIANDHCRNESTAETFERLRIDIFKLENKYDDLCKAKTAVKEQIVSVAKEMDEAKSKYMKFCSQGFKYP